MSTVKTPPTLTMDEVEKIARSSQDNLRATREMLDLSESMHRAAKQAYAVAQIHYEEVLEIIKRTTVVTTKGAP
jgi:hypothetical protein